MSLLKNIRILGGTMKKDEATTTLSTKAGGINTPAFREILGDVSDFPLGKSEDEVPLFIVKNQVWTILSKAAAEVRVIVHNNMVAALLVILTGSRNKLVVKGWPASRASRCMRQIQAEIKSAKTFPTQTHLLSTALVAHPDEEGNWCIVTPSAGPCLRSIIDHPDWGSKLSFVEREQITRHAAAHDMLALWRMHNKGLIYRDGKVDNMTFDTESGIFVKIDNGGVMKIFPNDYHPVCTPGYIPPEMRNRDAAGQYSMYWDPNKRIQATSKALDIWLSSYQVLDMVVGLGDLHFSNYNFQSEEETERHLDDMNAADFNKIIAYVPSRKARDYLRKTLHPDPNKRLTAAQALSHPWLKKLIPQALEDVADAAPAHAANVVAILDLFKDLQQLPGSFVAQVTPEDQRLAAQFTSSRAIGILSSDHDDSSSTSCGSRNSSGCDDSSSAADYMPATPVLRRSSCAPASPVVSDSDSIPSVSSCAAADAASSTSVEVTAGADLKSALLAARGGVLMDHAQPAVQQHASHSVSSLNDPQSGTGATVDVTPISGRSYSTASSGSAHSAQLSHHEQPEPTSSVDSFTATNTVAMAVNSRAGMDAAAHTPTYCGKPASTSSLLHKGKKLLDKLCRFGFKQKAATLTAARSMPAGDCAVAVPGCCGLVFEGFGSNKRARK